MLYIAGARQSRPAGLSDRDHEPLYDAALLATVDGVRAAWRDPFGPGHACKGLSAGPQGLLACTEREIRWLDTGARWTDPRLNDVHHALEHDGAVWVASTGADAVLEVRGDDVRVHPLGGALPPGDLRFRSLKPHRVHPNHLFVHRDQVWVTRLHDGRAEVVGGDARLDVDRERIHDGVTVDGRVWFTTVDGRLVGIGDDRRVIDLNDGRGPLGWCRGLAASGGWLWVGFTRLRATRWRHHLAWVRGRLRGRVDVSGRPTRLVAVDPVTGAVAREVDLEALGVDAVFGLVDA